MLITMRYRFIFCVIISIVFAQLLTNTSAKGIRGGSRGGGLFGGGKSRHSPKAPKSDDKYPKQPASNPHYTNTQQQPHYPQQPAHNPAYQQPPPYSQHPQAPPPYGANVPHQGHGQAPPPYGFNVPNQGHGQAPPPYGFNVPGNQAPPPYSKNPPSYGYHPGGGGGAPPYGQYPPSYGQYPSSYGQYPSSYGQYGNTKNKFFPSMGGMPIPIPIPLFIHSGSSGSRHYSQTSKSTRFTETITEGSDHNVTCDGDSISIQWTFPNGTNVPTSPINGEPSPITSFVDMNRKQGVLTFHNASTQASGTYICYINSPSGQQKGFVNINITPTKLTFSPSDTDSVTIKQNKEYSINCTGSVKSLTWFKDGQEISSKEQHDVFMLPPWTEGRQMTRQLMIEDMQSISEGKYLCSGFSAFNGAKIHRVVELKFQEDDTLSAPTFSSPTYPTGSLQTVTLFRNESFQINCIGDTENIEWLAPPTYSRIDEQTTDPRHHVHTKRIHKKKVALIFNETTSSLEGIYKCRVNKSKTNESVENKFELKVIEPASFQDTPSKHVIKEGDNVTLECVVYGRPKPSVNWFYKDKNVEQNQGLKYRLVTDSLILTNLTWQDAGKYVCEARQSVERGSTIRKAFEVEVLHKPYFSETNKTVERLFNTTGTVECNSVANPKAAYSWFRNNTAVWINGSEARKLEKNSIEVAFTNETAFGEYTCEASNEYGWNKQYIVVLPMILPYPPLIDIIGESDHNVTFKLVAPRNESISHFYVECAEESGKSWFYTNETKGSSWDHAYTLQHLKKNTHYVLRAKSMNAVGFSEFSPGIEFKTTSFAVNLSSSMGIIVLSIFLFGIQRQNMYK